MKHTSTFKHYLVSIHGHINNGSILLNHTSKSDLNIGTFALCIVMQAELGTFAIVKYPTYQIDQLYI